MLNEFTYPLEHTFNRRSQDYDWKSNMYFVSSKRITNGTVQSNYAML